MVYGKHGIYKRSFKDAYADYAHGFKEINENVKRVPHDVTGVMRDYSNFLGTAKSAKKGSQKAYTSR